MEKFAQVIVLSDLIVVYSLQVASEDLAAPYHLFYLFEYEQWVARLASKQPLPGKLISVNHGHLCLYREPNREPRDYFYQDNTQGPNIVAPWL